MKATFFNCENLVVHNGTFITNYGTRPGAPEGDFFSEVTVGSVRQQTSTARQRADEARQRAHEARREQARRDRRREREVRQQARTTRQGNWLTRWFGVSLTVDNYLSDDESTDSEEDDIGDLDFHQRVSLNGVRVEQRIGRRGEPHVEIFSQAEGQASDMSTASERATNERAERTRRQHGFNAVSSRSRGRPHSGVSVSFINNSFINTGRTSATGPQTSQPPKANPKSQSAQNPVYTERHESAASLIQRNFRIHRSLRTVDIISSEFQVLKDTFVYPRVVDILPGTEKGHISLRVNRAPSDLDEAQPKLAQTPNNSPIHTHRKQLEQLLVRLDGIESWGNEGVREKRRLLVKEVGKESAKLETFWKQAWVDYREKKQKEGLQAGGIDG